jgi:hypothetical protein
MTDKKKRRKTKGKKRVMETSGGGVERRRRVTISPTTFGKQLLAPAWTQMEILLPKETKDTSDVFGRCVWTTGEKSRREE